MPQKPISMKTDISDIKWKILRGLGGGGFLNMHDLFRFQVFEQDDKIVVCERRCIEICILLWDIHGERLSAQLNGI